MESAFSPYMPDAHTTPSVVLDMFSLARSLFSSKLAGPRPEADLHGKYFDSADIFGAGMEALASRVSTFKDAQQPLQKPCSGRWFRTTGTPCNTHDEIQTPTQSLQAEKDDLRAHNTILSQSVADLIAAVVRGGLGLVP